MTATIIDTTFTGKDITTAVSLYEHTAAAAGTYRFQVRFAAVAGNGNYVLYLTLNDGDAQSDDPIEPRTTIAVPSGVTAFWSPTISIDLLAGDVVNVMALGLAGDTSEAGSIRIFADNYATPATVWDYLTSAMTTAGSIGKKLADLLAVFNDTNRSLTTFGTLVADVWTHSTRSLTTFGTLVADIWSYVTRTITGGGGSAADIWAYLIESATTPGSIGDKLRRFLAVFNENERTLTQPAAQVRAAMTGSDLAITNGVTFVQSLTGLTIPANWAVIYLTAKAGLDADDDGAAMQIMVSNPADSETDTEADGLTVFNQAPAGDDQSKASLSVNQGAGTIAVAVSESLDLTPVAGETRYQYDIKCIKDDGDTVLLSGEAFVDFQLTPTRSIT